MKANRTWIAIFTSLFLILPFQASFGGEEKERAYGWQIMTQQEQLEHRERMRNFKTEEEREEYRQQHHARMTERARRQGVALPTNPIEGDRGRMRGFAASGGGGATGGGGAGGGSGGGGNR